MAVLYSKKISSAECCYVCFFLHLFHLSTAKRTAMADIHQPIVKAYTISELAALYGISTKTIKTWLRPHADAIGPRRGRYYTTLQIRTIFEKIGAP